MGPSASCTGPIGSGLSSCAHCQEGPAIATAFPPIRRTTQAEFIRIQLEERIYRGLLKPGDALDETQLAKEFEVSRTPVREALRQLEAIGIVGTRGRQGSMVAIMSRKEVGDTIELLVELFVYAMRLAAMRASPEARRRIAAIYDAGLPPVAHGASFGAFKAYIHDLRMMMVEAGGNDVLTREIRTYWQRINPFRRPDEDMPADYAGRVMEAMGELMRIVVAGDVDAVEANVRGQAQLVIASLADANATEVGRRRKRDLDFVMRSGA